MSIRGNTEPGTLSKRKVADAKLDLMKHAAVEYAEAHIVHSTGHDTPADRALSAMVEWARAEKAAGRRT